MTLIDTNVLLDLVTTDPVWAGWAQQELDASAMRGPILVNDIVYAELSVSYARIELVDEFLAGIGAVHAGIPRQALFLAGKVFRRYRARGGSRTGVLPEFFIGAHAAVSQLTLLTRDVRRYRNYFPGVRLVHP